MFRKEEKKEEPLIIPLLECNTWHNRIINKIDGSKSKTSNNAIRNIKIEEESKKVSNGDLTSVDMTSSNIQIKMELSTEITLEQAAKEIMEDLKSTEKNKDELCDITLSLVKRQDLNGAEEVSVFFS